MCWITLCAKAILCFAKKQKKKHSRKPVFNFSNSLTGGKGSNKLDNIGHEYIVSLHHNMAEVGCWSLEKCCNKLPTNNQQLTSNIITEH